ncbi:MAG: DinB family protein [Rhodothermales bacterium]|nr:DinB family protein [Rhodothermales bacterium]
MIDRPDDSVDHLLGQLEWTADEIEAQRPFIERLPDQQLSAAPVPDTPSIRQLYRELLDREHEKHLPAVADYVGREVPDALPRPKDVESVDEIMAAIVKSRRHVVDILRTIRPAEWGRTIPGGNDSLETFLHAAALNDAEVLRRIGERLYESELRLGDAGSMTD